MPPSLDRLSQRVALRFPKLKRRVIDPVTWLAHRVTDDQLGVEAGSMTYGAFLSIPPLLILAISAVSLVFAGHPGPALLSICPLLIAGCLLGQYEQACELPAARDAPDVRETRAFDVAVEPDQESTTPLR